MAEKRKLEVDDTGRGTDAKIRPSCFSGSSCPFGSLGDAEKKRMTMDRDHLLHIFPTEVWFLILEGCEDCKTLANLSNASPYLRNLLLSKRVQFLFPNVWSTLAVKYHEDIKIRPNPNSVYQEHNSSGRWFTGIIKLRLVCQAWCEGVDAWYQNPDHHCKLANDPKNCYDEKVGFLCTNRFGNLLQPIHRKDFDLHFAPTHTNFASFDDEVAIRNPFLGRAVEIQISGGESSYSHPLLDRLCRLLSKYGHYIWYCTIQGEDTFPYQIMFYRAVKRVLELMPNLKVLHFKYVRQPDTDPPHVQAKEIFKLGLGMMGDHVPTFGKLEFLKMTLSNCPSNFLDELLRRNRHISMLQVHPDGRQPCEYIFRTVSLPNLKQFSVKICSEYEFRRLNDPSVNWPLTRLDLDFGYIHFIEWQQIFDLLEKKWAETLTNLMISLPKAKDVSSLLEQCATLSLNLPRVTHLKLEIKNLTCLDFLLPMKDSLKFLEIWVLQDVTEMSQCEIVDSIENGKEIKLLSAWNRPKKSNVWLLFPKLKKACCEHEFNFWSNGVESGERKTRKWVCSREEWELENASVTHSY